MNLARACQVAAVVVALAPVVFCACQRGTDVGKREAGAKREADGSKREPSVAECEAWWSSADEQLSKVIAANHAKCERDEDCELVLEANGCLQGCFTAVTRSGRAEYDATKARLRGAECGSWQRGCQLVSPKPAPSCPMLTARCQDGRCTAVDEH